MSIAPGHLLGPYQLLSLLGEGGMGEVWKARDTRLDRLVAIKLSKAEFTARFENEARAVAALNHPNICTLHDIGPNYLVMEFIDGQPLTGPLPVDQTLRHSTQILDALIAAHKKGIIHRDLKPANILLTATGQIKLLDFGIAHYRQPIGPNDATVRQSLTSKGEILGTLQYMAPEQLHGKDADARSDIFAFGCLLYELLTGQPAFTGESTASIIAAVLERQPAPGAFPPPFQYIIETCLAKNPDDRWQSAIDLKRELLRPAPATAQAFAVPTAKTARWPLAAALTAGALLGFAGWLIPHHTSTTALPPARLDLELPSTHRIDPVGSQYSTPEISPDGSTVAYVSGRSLVLRPLASSDPILLRNADQLRKPCWSPDSRSFVAFTNQHVTKVRLADAASETILQHSQPNRGCAVSENGAILVAPTGDNFHLRLRTPAGEWHDLTIPGKGPATWPQFIPGSDQFIVHIQDASPARQGIYAVTLRNNKINGEPVLLKATPVHARFSTSGGGRLLFLDNNALYAQPFDPKALKLTGEPTLLAPDVASSPGAYASHFSVSNSGILLYRRGAASLGRITARDRQGNLLFHSGPPANIQSLRSVLAGSRIFAALRGGETWWIEPSQSRETPVPGDPNQRPSPDASRFFGWDDTGIWEAPATNPTAKSHFFKTPGGGAIHDVGPQGNILLASKPGSSDLLLVSRQPNQPPTLRPIPIPAGEELLSARLSPNAQAVVYSTMKTGEAIVFAQSLSAATRQQVSPTLGWFPTWTETEILYTQRSAKGPATLISVPATITPTGVRLGEQRTLFPLHFWNAVVVRNSPLDASPDGRRIFLLEDSAAQPEPEQNRLHVVTGW